MRCFGEGSELYSEYHDNEWGVPSRDDRYLFEMLILEGAQAGLSWETILKKREGYRKVFHTFDPKRVSVMTDQELGQLQKNPSIVRNRLKIFSARKNAQVFLEIQKEFGSFANFLWRYVNHEPVINRRKALNEIPVRTAMSDALSKDLKERGMSFVGSTIIYAYMQAVGLVNDHLETCTKMNDSKMGRVSARS